MDSAQDPHDGRDSPDKQPQPPSPTTGSKDNQAPKKANVRKRTKTGCQTCRKRRIKCDEGKPTCNNCIKSKRQCEGYNTRVVFKEPMGTPQGGPFGPLVYRPDPTDALMNAQLSGQAKSSSSQGPLPIIAPKPPSVDYGVPNPFHYPQVYQVQPRSASGASINLPQPPYTPQHAPHNQGYLPSDPSARPAGQTQLGQDDLQNFQPVPQTIHEQFPNRVPGPVRRQSAFARIERPAVSWPQADDVPSMETLLSPQDDGYWYSDDDASMAASDDDEVPDSHEVHLESNDLGILVSRQAPFNMSGTHIRTFHALAGADILASYTPSSNNSPLNDKQTAAIFWRFVNVTGPSMSLYERHPFDPSPMFQGQPVPKARQHIWTYTFPIISLNHPALLQAILALGSLQMAKLEGIPATAALKHYHLSIRRIAKNYQSTNRRSQPATLAATLLLGFYEVWNSDHDKWCKHMFGARAILQEIPLREMTKAVLSLKRRERQLVEDLESQQPYDEFRSHLPRLPNNDMDSVDLNLLGQISGRPQDYEEYYAAQLSSRLHTERDLENYEHLADLFWWYCKMDIYQSFLGGTRLFMDYHNWSQCIPRGPIGRIDAIYGTFDHLMLLLGRLASFASKDLARKRKARKQEGGGGPGQGTSPPMFVGMLPRRGHVTLPAGFSPPRETSPQSDGMDDIDLEASTAAALQEWASIRQAFEIYRAHLGPDFDPMGPEYEPPQSSPFGPARTYRTYSIAGIWMNYYMGMIALYRAHPSMPPFAMVAAGMAAQSTAPYALELGRVAAGLAEDCTNVTAVSTLVGAAFIESCFCLFVAAVQYQDTAQRHWTVKRLHDIARLTGWQSARQIANGCEAAWMKAAALNRGPHYERDPTLEIRVHESVWANPRRIDSRIQELSSDDGKRVVLAKFEQAHYALGLLGVEQDLEKLELREGP